MPPSPDKRSCASPYPHICGKAQTFLNRLLVQRFTKRRCHRLVITIVAGKARPFPGLLLDTLSQRLCVDLVIFIRAEHLKRFG